MTKVNYFWLLGQTARGTPILELGYWSANDELSIRNDIFRAGFFNDARILMNSGALSEILSVDVKGINFQRHFEFGTLLPALLLPFNLLFRTYLVRVRVTTGPARIVSLPEAKEILVATIRANENYYTHAPATELIARISRAKTLQDAMDKFSRD